MNMTCARLTIVLITLAIVIQCGAEQFYFMRYLTEDIGLGAFSLDVAANQTSTQLSIEIPEDALKYQGKKLRIVKAAHDPISKNVILVYTLSIDDDYEYMWIGQAKLCGQRHNDVVLKINKLWTKHSTDEYNVTLAVHSVFTRGDKHYYKQFVYYNSTVYFVSRSMYQYRDGLENIRIELRTVNLECDAEPYNIYTCSEALFTIMENRKSMKRIGDQDYNIFTKSIGENYMAEHDLNPVVDHFTGQLTFYLHIWNKTCCSADFYDVDLWRVPVDGVSTKRLLTEQRPQRPGLAYEFSAYKNGYLCWTSDEVIQCAQINNEGEMQDQRTVINLTNAQAMCDTGGYFDNGKDRPGRIFSGFVLLDITDKTIDALVTCYAQMSRKDGRAGVYRFRSIAPDVAPIMTPISFLSDSYMYLEYDKLDFMIQDSDLTECTIEGYTGDANLILPRLTDTLIIIGLSNFLFCLL